MRISDWSSDACSSDLLNYCRIEKSEAIHSELAVLGLDGSCLQAGLDAGGLRCGGGVYLRGGFHALDTVNLVGATIGGDLDCDDATRSEEHTSELQSLMRISYAVFCLKKKK